MIEYISHLIERQFPDLYREEGPQLVAFLRAYYEFLEQSGQVVYDSRDNLTSIDIDTAGDAFISHFKATYMNGVPTDLIGDPRFLQKHILDLYRSKGSSEGMRLLFRLLFNEEIDVYIPSYDILKASDGKWVERRYIEITKASPGTNYLDKIVYGNTSGAWALVESHEQILINSRIVDLLYVSNISGIFEADEYLFYDGQVTADYVRVLGSPTTVTMLESDLDFERGDAVFASDGTGRYLEGVVAATTNIATGFIDFELIYGGTQYSEDANVTITPLGTGTGANFSFTIGNTTPFDFNTDLVAPYINVHASAFVYSSANVLTVQAANAEHTAWSKLNMTAAGGYADPVGGLTAETVLETAANVSFSVSQMFSGTLYTGNSYAIEAVVEAIGNRDVILSIYNNGFSASADFGANLASGVAIYYANTAPFVYDGVGTVSDEGDGWYRLNLQFHVTSNVVDPYIALSPRPSPDTPGTYLGDITKGLGFYYAGILHLNDATSFAGANLSSNIIDTLTYLTVNVGPIASIQTTSPGETPYDADVIVTIVDPYTGDSSANVVGRAVFGTGIVSDIRIMRSGYGYTDGEEVIFLRTANTAMTATATINLGGVGRERGYWRNEDGFLNSIKKLQDSYYYQEYSYDLQTTRPLESYMDILKRVMHPVGNEAFGSTRVYIRVDYPFEVTDDELVQTTQ